MIAMSGGVDSSVAACLMKESGYDCMGVTMYLYRGEDRAAKKRRKTCCSLDDVEDARSVAFQLGIPYHVFNFTDEFEREVIRRFVIGYENGETPNPCLDCNRYLKFGRFLHRAEELGYGCVATGHYARIEKDPKSGRFLLKKALDEAKDQSYVLYAMTQDQLAHTVFPLGNLRKAQVRRIAEEHGFRNAQKRDSEDICFVPDGGYAGFLERYTGQKYACGDFVSRDGRVLGRHKGIVRYTVGQRKGLGLSEGKPLYVCAKCARCNTVTLGGKEDLFSRSLAADRLNLISCGRLDRPARLSVRIRYGQREQPATVTQMDGGTVRVVFDEPQCAVSPGQAVVFYDGDTVVGGATIRGTDL